MNIIGDGIVLGAGGETASIVVTAPTGSTVTCTTPAGIVLTVSEVGGTWTFAKLKVYGTYTITATYGTSPVTMDVLVDSANTFYVSAFVPAHTELEISSTGTLTVYGNRTVTKKNSGDAIRFVCIVYFPSVNSNQPYYITQVLLSKTLGVESLYNSYNASVVWSSQNRTDTWWVPSIEYYGETWYAGVDGYGWLGTTYDAVKNRYQSGYLLNSLANNGVAFSDSESAFRKALDYYYGIG